MALWTHIVELYEYKVDDTLQARTPKGGTRSLRELRDLLATAPLAGATLRRFRMADRALRGKPEVVTEKTDLLSEEPQPTSNLEMGLAVGEADLISMSMSGFETVDVNEAALDEEGMILRALADAAWRAEFTEELLGQSMRLRNESGRNTSRGVFAMMQNLEQYAESSDFGSDLNLAKFKVISKVPVIDDPLATFSSPEVIENMLGDFIQKLLEMGRGHPNLHLPTSETLAYLRRPRARNAAGRPGFRWLEAVNSDAHGPSRAVFE